LGDMKAIILAGGYAKRLWPLTIDRPKPLLPLGNLYILDYLMSKVWDVQDIEEVIIATNKKFESNFIEWAESRGCDNVRIFPEPSKSEDEKLGPVKAIDLIIDAKGPSEYLIAAGDNLFSLNLRDMVSFYREVKSPVIALYEIGNLELSKQYASVELDSSRKIINFQEKSPSPKSTLVSTGIYLLPWESISRIKEYLAEGNPPDPIGKFIGWLASKQNVYGFRFEGYWFDIGSKETYLSAQEAFSSLKYAGIK